MLEDIYVIRDWTSLSQVKNFEFPSRRANASVSKEGSITITILERKDILFRFKVNSVNEWSLSDKEAEELLNSCGFNCRFENTSIITDRVKKVLSSVKSLGANFVIRQVKPKAAVYVCNKDFSKQFILSEDISCKDGCFYKDWVFMYPGIVYSIDQLLSLPSLEETETLSGGSST